MLCVLGAVCVTQEIDAKCAVGLFCSAILEASGKLVLNI